MSPLDRNLEALRRARPVTGGPTREQNASLSARLRAGGTAPEVAPSPWPALPDAPLVLCVGAASPAGLRDALAAGRTLWLWERSAPLLRAFLTAVDVADALRDGRLRLACDLDLLDLRLPEGTPVVAHPLLGPRYARELAWLAHRPARRALVVDGGLMVEEVSRALAAEGYGLWTWETGRLPPEELERIALSFRPERVFVVNHAPGVPEAVEALTARLPGLHLDVWEIDPSIEPIRPPRRPVPHTTVHTWRKLHVPLFQAAGYRASWLPLASDPDWRRPVTLTPDEQATYGAPVTFVGRSMLLEGKRYQKELVARIAATRRGERATEEAAALVAGVLAEQRQTPEVYRLPALLRERCPELPAPSPDRREADPAALAGEVAAAELRLSVVATLGRFGAHVWGDEGWKAVVPHGVTWRGPAGHAQQLPRIYSNGGIHVDIGRIYQLDIVTLRVFDVLACGGFLLAHHNAELEELFVVGEELETWRTLPELVEKVRHYLDRPEDRQRIAAAGRARVLRDHTVRGRLAAMGAQTAQAA